MNFEKNTIKDLETTQKDSFAEKKENLDLVKEIIQDRFGKENLPKDLVLEMINIRKEIKREIEKVNFVEELDEVTDNHIKLLMAEIQDITIKRVEIKEINEDQDGIIKISFENGEEKILGTKEMELLFSLRLYFDSYRLAHNANQFRSNINEIKSEIIKDNKERKLNFYSEAEKKLELIDGLREKYGQAGFSEDELKELVKICDIKDINDLPIHQIEIMKKVKDIFSRFMEGDKTKYIGISAALVIPAFIQGYSPKFLSDAFKDSNPDMNQIVLYALSSFGGSGLSMWLQKHYKDFINSNYKKEGGVGEFTAKNLTEFPPEETNRFGQETVKSRSKEGLNSYEGVLNTFSFDILPTVTMLITSAAVLFEKSPILAGGTILGSGITIALDKYLQKYGKFWEKQRSAEKNQEEMSKKINQQLRAQMEIILAGEKEKFFSEMKSYIEKNKIAQSNKNYFEVLSDGFRNFSGIINMTILGLASKLAGASNDQFIAAILYSNNFIYGIQNLLRTKRKLLRSIRSIMQMELMFNGYAQEEEDKEKNRIGINQVKNNDISLKNVNVEIDNKRILENISLDIPAGSMAHLSGASGAGKTTLMKVISGYYHPTSGEVELGGVSVENIKKTGDESIYNRIAYLSQFPYLFEGSLKENLKFGLKNELKDGQIEEILREVGLNERFNNLDEKLLGGSGNSINTSGGETSRIGLARVLLKIRNSDSKIVFLDEPTASVDKKTKKDIAEIINNEKLKRPETTFIVISHDESFVKMLNCNIEVKIEKGKIIEE